MALYLFEIKLGYTPKGLNSEQHDMFYGVGESIDDPYLHAGMFRHTACVLRNGEKTHIDGWRIIDRVGDWKVQVVLANSPLPHQAEKLFYANLGGYKKGERFERHKELLLVLPEIEHVKTEALKDSFCKEVDIIEDAMPHVDNKMQVGADVDDSFNIEDKIPGYRIILTYEPDLTVWKTTGFKPVEPFVVTHVITEDPPVEGFRKLCYMTALAGNEKTGPYYSGFGTHRPFSVEDLKPKLDAGSLVEVNVIPMTRNDSVWRGVGGDYFLCSGKDPLVDKLDKLNA